jgi:hypothetical protein
MNSKDKLVCGFTVCALAILAVGGTAINGAIGMRDGRDRTRIEAIEANVAEWRIDPKTGEKSFVWLTPQQAESEERE